MSARARVSLVSWEGESHAMLFMVPLGHPGAWSMPKRYCYHLSINNLMNLTISFWFQIVIKFSEIIFLIKIYIYFKGRFA